MYPPNLNKHNSYGSLRKVKNYSYNPLDSIGKGFSSVVYRGQNEETSNKIQCMAACLLFDSIAYSRRTRRYQSHRHEGSARFSCQGNARVLNRSSNYSQAPQYHEVLRCCAGDLALLCDN